MGFLCTSGLVKPIIVPKSFRCCHGRAYGPPSSANLIPQPWHPLFAPNFKLLTCASTLLAAHQNNSGTEVVWAYRVGQDPSDSQSKRLHVD